MPLYKVSWRLAHDVTWPQRRKWSNTAYVTAPSSTTAAAAGVAAWVSYLALATDNSVFCYEVYATDLTPGTDDYATQSVPPSQQRGDRATPGGEKYLLKAVATVTINVPGSRPSRKFWRMGLHEADVVNGADLNVATLEALTIGLGQFAGDETWADPDGQLYASVGRIHLSTREFGRYAGNDVPSPPALG